MKNAFSCLTVTLGLLLTKQFCFGQGQLLTAEIRQRNKNRIRHGFVALILLLVVVGLAFAAKGRYEPQSSPQRGIGSHSHSRRTAIIDANVLPMTTERIIPGLTFV